MTLKSQQRFKSKRHNVFIQEMNKMASCSNDDKSLQSIDSVKINVLRVKEKIKCNNIIMQYKNYWF